MNVSRWIFGAAAAIAPCLASAVASADEKIADPALIPMASGAAYCLIVAVPLLALAGVLMLVLRLRQTNNGPHPWSLTDALSEEATITNGTSALAAVAPAQSTVAPAQAPVAPAQAPVAPAQTPGTPAQTTTILVASTSRLIALIGMIVIIALFIGIGVIVLWYLAVCGKVPDLSAATKYLFGGAALFVPYSVNQLRTAFEAFGTNARVGQA